MRIVVIENYAPDLDDTLSFLKEAFPDASIVPDDSRTTFGDWTEAYDFLKSQSNDEPVVAVLDLALSDQTPGASMDGLQHIKSLRRRCPQWTLVAYTSFGLSGDDSKTFDSILQKFRVQQLLDNREACVTYFRSLITEAFQAKNSTAPGATRDPFQRVDSLGMRLLESSIGNDRLRELIAQNAQGWEDVRVSALSGGYSGAMPLRLEGRTGSGKQVLVLKVARDIRALEGEGKAHALWRAKLGPLAGRIIVADGPVKELPSGHGYYLVQPEGPSATLLQILETGEAAGYLKSIATLLQRAVQSSSPDFPLSPLRSCLTLSALDLARILSSLSLLENAGSHLERRGDWPSEASPGAVVRRVRDFAEQWTESPWTATTVPVCLQHGDLNPGNVLVDPPSNVILIDLARLGLWPVGYDFCRLSLMLRLRLEGTLNGDDLYPLSVRTWREVPLSRLLEGVMPGTADRGLQAAGGLLASLGRILERDTSLGARARFGALACLVWDLLKVLSYSDISTSKRIWALLELADTVDICERLAETLASPVGSFE